MKNDLAEFAVMSPVPIDRRKEDRAVVEFPIEVSGFDFTGRSHVERTTTRNVADSSCSFNLRMRLEKGMAIGIRVLSAPDGHEADLTPVLFFVVRVNSIPGEFTVGAVKLAPKAPWKVLSAPERQRRELLF